MAKVTGVKTSKAGRWYVDFDDGTQLEFASLEALQQYGSVDESGEDDRKFTIRSWIAQDPKAEKVATVVGKTPVEVAVAADAKAKADAKADSEKPVDEKPVVKG
jgi:hypothetical protein